jgi:excisionase family DNA binding protein
MIPLTQTKETYESMPTPMNYNYELEQELGLLPKLDPKFETIPDEWTLTPEQIADLTGMSVISVRRWCRHGKLPAYQFARKYVITGIAFKEFMSHSRVRTRQAKEAFSGH